MILPIIFTSIFTKLVNWAEHPPHLALPVRLVHLFRGLSRPGPSWFCDVVARWPSSMMAGHVFPVQLNVAVENGLEIMVFHSHVRLLEGSPTTFLSA